MDSPSANSSWQLAKYKLIDIGEPKDQTVDMPVAATNGGSGENNSDMANGSRLKEIITKDEAITVTNSSPSEPAKDASVNGCSKENAGCAVVTVDHVSPNGGSDDNGSNEEGEDDPSLNIVGGPWRMGLFLFIMNIRNLFKLDEIGSEVLRIAVPSALAFAADPLASLVDTAFIGRLGAVEIAAVGVAIAIFTQVSKICIYPLVSVTTSFVAEEDAIISKGIDGEGKLDLENVSPTVELKDAHPNSPTDLHHSDSEAPECNNNCIKAECENLSRLARKRKYIPSATSALIVGAFLGIIQAILLIFAARPLLSLMGVQHDSGMLKPALRYLTIRALSSPAVLLSLAMQGVFRGFKDTKTPLYATLAGDAANIILDPILIFLLHMGVAGAAISHAISQFLITIILLCKLVQKIDVIPTSLKSLKLRRFLGCGFLLLARVIAVTFCVTLAASLATHHGSTVMAAFQICSQLWMATSLLTDGLAVAAQAVLASSFAKNDYNKVVNVTARVLQMSIVLGLVLTLVLGIGMLYGAGVFTRDSAVIKIIHQGIPFVAGTQTINSLAFIFDGINFGASDYTYSAYSMVAVAALSIPLLIYLSSRNGFIGIWIALIVYMSLRTLASTWRMGAARGPWTFLRR